MNKVNTLLEDIYSKSIEYDYCWHDLVGNIGVSLLIMSYLALQLGKLRADGLWYSWINLCVALLLGINLYHRPNLSSIIIEIFWALISLYGIFRCWVRKSNLR